MKDTHKYRIRVITRRNGTVVYQAHTREIFAEWIPAWMRLWEWKYISEFGGEYEYLESHFNTKEIALAAIDAHKSYILEKLGNDIIKCEDIYL